MTGPAPSKRTRMMVEAYEAGATRFPSVGPAGHELYRVGSCQKCEVALFAYRPEPLVLCGHCIAITGTLL